MMECKCCHREIKANNTIVCYWCFKAQKNRHTLCYDLWQPIKWRLNKLFTKKREEVEAVKVSDGEDYDDEDYISDEEKGFI